MDLNKYNDTLDSDLKMFAFSEEPIQVFIDAFDRYKICLSPLRGDGNNTIEKELVLIDEIVTQLQQKQKIARVQGDAPVRLIFINWCLFTDVVFKYAAIKNTEYKEKESKVFSKYALEGEKAKLDAINRTAQIPLFAEMDRQRDRNRAKVNGFYLTDEMIKNINNYKTTSEHTDNMNNNTKAKETAVKEFEYDVAFSYAGEQAVYVEQVARYIDSNGVRVFMDKLKKVDMWGTNLIDYLTDIYANKARWCVMFISQEYADSAFPNLERQIIESRNLTDKDYLLPARFDSAVIQGSVHTKTYIPLSGYTPEQFGDLILEKINKVKHQTGDHMQTENGGIMLTKPLTSGLWDKKF